MPRFHCTGIIPTQESAGPNIRAAGDVNDDGKSEVMLVGPHSTELAAYDLVLGSVLWTRSIESAGAVRCAIADWDGDGRTELFVVDGTRLLLLNGIDGSAKAEAQLPVSGRVLHIGKGNMPSLRPGVTPLLLIHGAGVVAIGTGLEVLWQVPAHGRGVGHEVFCGDVNGDGDDECLFSIEGLAELLCIDREGTVLWSKNILRDLRLCPDGVEDHIDHLRIIDIDEDGRNEILVATGGCCLSGEGLVKWGHNESLIHGQRVCAGTFENAGSPIAAFVDAWTPVPQIVASDGRGELLWTYRDLHHRIFDARRLNSGRGYILVSEQDYQEGHPLYHLHLLDGAGRRMDQFSFKDEGGFQMPFNPQAGKRPSNLLWRGTQITACRDFDGDGEEEVLLEGHGGVVHVLKVVAD